MSSDTAVATPGPPPLGDKNISAEPNKDVLLTDSPPFEETPTAATRPVSMETDDPSPPSSITTTDTAAIDGDPCYTDEAIIKRKQPLMELAYSEESYVRRLRVAYELYMPAAYRAVLNSDANNNVSPLTIPSAGQGTGSGFEELASKLPPGGPTVPEDLIARWRILWGNWMQLYEWHTGFYEKLRTLLDEDPDRIPKLFIDSRARLRSIYSKYCENQIKAAHIAEQHKEFFDEWRLHVGDKDDVISLLMQPVQRIMRYQLPISEIVKWTKRANLPSLQQWQKALDIMKEIPKDTQLILEVCLSQSFRFSGGLWDNSKPFSTSNLFSWSCICYFAATGRRCCDCAAGNHSLAIRTVCVPFSIGVQLLVVRNGALRVLNPQLTF